MRLRAINQTKTLTSSVRAGWNALVAVALLILTGCDQTFEAMADTDSVFSIFAVLNASADTQWVRVMPIRQSVLSGPAGIDATVTFEHLETGRVIELRDSLFGYTGADPDIVATLYVHNFWTTERLVRGGTYTVRASRSDGGSAYATVRVPFSVRRVVVSVRQSPHVPTDVLRVDSDGHVAHLQVFHTVVRDGKVVVLPQRQALEGLHRTGAGVSSVALNRSLFMSGDEDYMQPLPPRPKICSQDRFCTIIIAISGAEWPFKETLPDLYVTQSDAISNVEGGTGFVGAVLLHEVPYESCVLNPMSLSTPCELVYDENSATVVGTVTDNCGVRLPGAWVVLRYPDRSRTRTARTRDDGSFRIGAVQPGITHEILVQELTEHESKELVVPPLTPGETRTLPVGVQRVDGCE